MKQRILDYCNSLGLSCVGMIPCRKLDELSTFLIERQAKNLQNEFEEEDIEKRINPNIYMDDAKTIISIAFPYRCEESVVDNGFSTYTKRYDYHRVVKDYLDQICQFIESQGGKAVGLVDSNALPERYLAYLAGNGFIGRNNMLITKEYGSYVFLGEIITDLEIACEEQRNFEEISEYKECGDCQICYHQCPSKSINGARINPNICLSYITQKKAITDKEMALLKGNVFGCDFCQLSCPFNEGAKFSPLKEFSVLTYMEEGAETFANMDNKYFKEKISMTSCGWRGKNVLKRNSIIRLAREGEEIEQYKGDSPYINEYIERLCEKTKSNGEID